MTKFNIVLFKPEIPQNTGNIIRTCVGLNATLHLIKPYGFNLDFHDRVFKRNSTNYLEKVELIEYENFEEFEAKNNNQNFYFLTRFGKAIYSDINLSDHPNEIFYIFGNESSGIDREILEKYKNQTFRIPSNPIMRSLNLANCVALVSFDGARQQNFEGLSMTEVQKSDYWEKGSDVIEPQ